jgi:hypothetical protein
MLELLAMAAALRLPPVEQCTGDPAFNSVRAEFRAAVEARDARRLASLASADVLMDEEGYYKGPASLIELMGSERGPDYWRELLPVPEGGCTADEDGRVLPSFLPRLIGGDEPMIVAGAREPIRAGPEPDAKILGYARWDWVDHNYADSGPFYWHVRLRSGRIGYIRSERIYSTYSPFAEFQKRDGKWQLVMLRLIAAD